MDEINWLLIFHKYSRKSWCGVLRLLLSTGDYSPMEHLITFDWENSWAFEIMAVYFKIQLSGIKERSWRTKGSRKTSSSTFLPEIIFYSLLTTNPNGKFELSNSQLGKSKLSDVSIKILISYFGRNFPLSLLCSFGTHWVINVLCEI